MRRRRKKQTPKKETIVKVRFDVFGYTTYFIVSEDIMEARDKRNVEIGHSYECEHQIEGLHSYNKKHPISYIFLTNKPRYDTVIHECVHAISRMMQFYDIPFQEEVFAYHLDYLFNQINTKAGFVFRP